MKIQLTIGKIARKFALSGVIWVSALVVISLPALAEERLVHGQVTKVVPITKTQIEKQISTACHHPKPSTNHGLEALLSWDLLYDCNTMTATEVVTGYEVFYRWDNRTYSRTMTQYPGKTIPLMLSVD